MNEENFFRAFAGAEPLRLAALRGHYASELAGEVPEGEEFLSWCRYILGAVDAIPETSQLFRSGSVDAFIQAVLAIDGAWHTIDDRIVDCLVRDTDVRKRALVDLCERAEEVNAMPALLARLALHAIREGEVHFARFRRAEFVREGVPTPYGAFVLAQEPAWAIARAEETGSATPLAELYLAHAPERFTSHRKALLSALRTPIDHAFFLGALGRHRGTIAAEDLETILASLGNPNANAIPHFVAAFHLRRDFPAWSDRAFEVAAGFAEDVLCAKKDPFLDATYDYANGHRSLKPRLIEWLLTNYGARAKKLVAAYEEETARD